MKKHKQKRIKTGEERALQFALFHNGLFKQKIIPNKKKKIKKFSMKDLATDYLNDRSLFFAKFDFTF